MRAAHGLGTDAAEARIPLAQPPGAGVLRSGEPQIVEDWMREPHSTLTPVLAHAGVRASLAVPIPGEESRVRTVAIHTREPRRFTQEEIDCLQAVANLIAGAVERDRSEQEIRHQALHDPLTGLPNRALVNDRLALALAHCERRGCCTAVLFLDLDDFKLVNDSLGHGAGDELLRALAARLDGVLARATPSRASAVTSSS